MHYKRLSCPHSSQVTTIKRGSKYPRPRGPHKLASLGSRREPPSHKGKPRHFELLLRKSYPCLPAFWLERIDPVVRVSVAPCHSGETPPTPCEAWRNHATCKIKSMAKSVERRGARGSRRIGPCPTLRVGYHKKFTAVGLRKQALLIKHKKTLDLLLQPIFCS